jgi:hypothetical protein
VDERYSAKINELLVYVDRNFKLFNLSVDRFSNLLFSFEGIQRSVKILGNVGREENDSQFVQEAVAPEVKGFFDFLKSRKKREKEKMERLQMEADIKNSQSQYKVQEQIRRKQEARQLASSDLDELLRVLTDIVIKGMNEKYEDLFLQIQQIDCLNKQIIEDGKRQMKVLNELRNRMMSIENSL